MNKKGDAVNVENRKISWQQCNSRVDFNTIFGYSVNC
jgi:hypothetical protein